MPNSGFFKPGFSDSIGIQTGLSSLKLSAVPLFCIDVDFIRRSIISQQGGPMLDRLTSPVSEVGGCNRSDPPEEDYFSKATQEQQSFPEAMNSKSSPKHYPNASHSPKAGNVSLSKFEEEILSLLMGHELYGLQIIQAFEETSNGQRKVSIGSLYPTLSRLEEKGLVTSRMVDRPTDDKGGARRKYFRITRRGASVLLEADEFRRRLGDWQPAI
jgi:PadR family transcriptional regulator, regulatory protein PadR